MRCPNCRASDRVHYFDIRKAYAQPDEPIKCSTFKFVCTLNDLGVGKPDRSICCENSDIFQILTGHCRAHTAPLDLPVSLAYRPT